MAPATEIAILPLAIGAKLEDPNSPTHTIWQSCLDTIASQEGYQRLYWGRKVEAPNVLQLLIDWDNVDFHKKFMSSREYGPFMEHFGKLLDGPASIYHANLSPHPPAPATASSRSPVTECLTFYHPTDADTSAFEEKWSASRSSLEQHAEGYRASSAGWVVEELEYEHEMCKAFAIFIGWESIDAHMKFRDTDHFKKSIMPLREGLKGITACHATMQER